MQRFWKAVIEPVFEVLRPETIVEIGSDQGVNTENLLVFCRRSGATLHVVDPSPGYDAAALQQQHGGQLVFHKDLSLNALPRIGCCDAILIDGDHNWYTVYNELRLIEALCEERSRPFPLVMLHDIYWPYGRRDLYYAPETIPEDFRNPHAQKGMLPGVEGLLEHGGMNHHLHNAVRENDKQSGVLTAIQDFLDETQQNLQLIKLPGIHGLAILVPAPLKEENPLLAGLLREMDLSPFISRYVEAVERDRLRIQIRQQEEQAELGRTRRELENARSDVARLVQWLEALEEGMGALLQSRQWKAGHTIGELYRRLLFKPKESAIEEHVETVLGKFHIWREEQRFSEQDFGRDQAQEPDTLT